MCVVTTVQIVKHEQGFSVQDQTRGEKEMEEEENKEGDMNMNTGQ